MRSQLLLSKVTRPLLTHQSQEAIIIPSLYRMPFLPRKLQSSLLTLGLCSCQERNVAPLTQERVSSTWGTADPRQACHPTPTIPPLYPSPHPKLWFGGKNTGKAAVVPSFSHPSPTQTSVLRTGVTRCNVVTQETVSVTWMNSSKTGKITPLFTAGKTVLG